MHCDIFKEVYDRIFTITGKLVMTLSGSRDFQADDMGSYALFFQGFVAQLEAFTKEFLGAIEAKAREVAMLAGERVFTNLHLIDPAFPFVELVKSFEKSKRLENSREATVGFVEELVGVFAPDNGEGGLEDPTSADGSSDKETDPEIEA